MLQCILYRWTFISSPHGVSLYFFSRHQEQYELWEICQSVHNETVNQTPFNNSSVFTSLFLLTNCCCHTCKCLLRHNLWKSLSYWLMKTACALCMSSSLNSTITHSMFYTQQALIFSKGGCATNWFLAFSNIYCTFDQLVIVL